MFVRHVVADDGYAKHLEIRPGRALPVRMKVLREHVAISSARQDESKRVKELLVWHCNLGLKETREKDHLRVSSTATPRIMTRNESSVSLPAFCSFSQHLMITGCPSVCLWTVVIRSVFCLCPVHPRANWIVYKKLFVKMNFAKNYQIFLLFIIITNF